MCTCILKGKLKQSFTGLIMFSNLLYKQLSGNEWNVLNFDDNISATGMSFLFFSFSTVNFVVL